jgi:hypothetical protein
MTRRNDRIRFKYGICLNDECEKCKSKEVQQVPMRKELVCEVCGKELRECPPPKKGNKVPLIIGGTVVALAVIIGIGFLAFGNSTSKEEPATAPVTTDSIATTDSTKAAPVEAEAEKDTTVEEAAPIQNPEPTTKQQTSAVKKPAKQSIPTSAQPSSGTLRLSYGKYSGAIKNGYPHGQGRLTYTTSRQINRNDAKGRTANAGDYVIGEFYNGFVVYGKHYDSAGNLIGSLNFGVGSESSYESK